MVYLNCKKSQLNFHFLTFSRILKEINKIIFIVIQNTEKRLFLSKIEIIKVLTYHDIKQNFGIVYFRLNDILMGQTVLSSHSTVKDSKVTIN